MNNKKTIRITENQMKRVIIEMYEKENKFKNEIDPTYTHFALRKSDQKILTGWEYKDLDKESIKEYAKMDIVDMDENPKDYTIITVKGMSAKNIDPFDSDNWIKPGMGDTINEFEDDFEKTSREVEFDINPDSGEESDEETPVEGERENTDDPSKEQMMAILNNELGGLEGYDKFSAEEAIYWYSNNYHGGQDSNLYSALSTSEYKPSRMISGIEESEDEMSMAMYNTLVSNFGGDVIDLDYGANEIDETDHIEGESEMSMRAGAKGKVFESVSVKKTDKKDDFSRPIYKGKNGKVYVDVSLGKNKKPDLHSVTKSGEPDIPLKDFEVESDELNEAVNRFKKIINY